MRTALDDLYNIYINTIHNSIGLINTPAPVTCQITTKSFRFPYTAIAIAFNVFQ